MENNEWLAVSNQNQEKKKQNSAYYYWPSEAHFYFAEFCFAFQLVALTLSLWAPGQGLLLLSWTRKGSTGPQSLSGTQRTKGPELSVPLRSRNTRSKEGLCPRG